MKTLPVIKLLIFLLCNSAPLIADTYPQSWSKPLILNKKNLELAEGPVWDGKNTFYFSEIRASKIHSIDLQTLQISELAANMNHSNGLAIDKQGLLWIAMQNLGQIVKLKPGESNWQIHASEYQGKRFNHPNDLALDDEGGVYFSDPAWNASHIQQPLNGVYYVDKNKKVHLLIDDMDKPNGVLLTNKQDFLYVVDMGTREFRRYPVLSAGKLGGKENFSEFKKFSDNLSGPDGMAEDEFGNIYVAVDREIQIFNPSGKFLIHIPLPEQVTNLAFVGSRTLFVTALENIYKVELRFN